MIIRKNDTFVNDNGELVCITGRHFGTSYTVSIYHYNEDTEDYDIFDRTTVLTQGEVRRLARVRDITWSDEED